MTACPFCEYLAGVQSCAFVHRGKHASAFLNRAQYERGALLVVPNDHIVSLLDAGDEQVGALYVTARQLARLLVDGFGATGVNVFQNNGASAGQTIPHCHVHVVPRYPASDPSRIFREGDYPVTPIEELRRIASDLISPVQ